MDSLREIRLKTLWRVPAVCLITSWFSYYITIYLGGRFFTTQTVGADGVTAFSVDPVRSLIFDGALFVAALLIGGLWCCRSMTKGEVAASAAIISTIYLLIVLLQLFWKGFPVSLSLELAKFQSFTTFAASCLIKITDSIKFSVIAASFVPFLLVPFGGKRSGKSDGSGE